MKNYMEIFIRNKKRALIIGLLIIFVLTVFIALSLSSTSPTRTQPIVNTPTPFYSSSKELRIISLLPQENVERIDPPIQPVEITFSKPISENGIKVTTQPETQLYVDNKSGQPSIIILSPNPIWSEGITTITILPETQSEDGTTLNRSYTLKIHSQLPKNPPEWGNPYD